MAYFGLYALGRLKLSRPSDNDGWLTRFHKQADPEILTGFWRIFSAPIFRGTDWSLACDVQRGKFALEIPAHRQIT